MSSSNAPMRDAADKNRDLVKIGLDLLPTGPPIGVPKEEPAKEEPAKKEEPKPVESTPPQNRTAQVVHLRRSDKFPGKDVALEPVSIDKDGTPLYFGRAHMSNGSITPCKLRVPSSGAVTCLAPYGGQEVVHQGEYDVVPFNRTTMRLAKVNGKNIDQEVGTGKKIRLVEGGKENDNKPLWHAVSKTSGISTPGKAAVHLAGAAAGFNGKEERNYNEYDILCWRD